MNYFRNAKQLIETGQNIAKVLSDLQAEPQNQTASGPSASNPASQSPDSKKETPKVNSIHNYNLFHFIFRHKT
jgi:hypothetical protein